MSEVVPESVRRIIEEVRVSVGTRGQTVGNLASAAGVSKSYLNSWLAGNRKLTLTRLVQACKSSGIAFTSVAAAIDALAGGTNYLRVTHASRVYECSYCDDVIRRDDLYVRLEPFGPTRQSGAPVQYFCHACSVAGNWVGPIETHSSDAQQVKNEDSQLVFPFADHVKPTLVELIDVTDSLAHRILADPAELFSLSPSQFEEFVMDRLSSMGLIVAQVGGGTFRRDGGIDIIFTPPRSFPMPFLGAVQVKHRRDPNSKIGPGPLRELMGVLSAQKIFSAGMIVTNTSFSPDARNFAARIGAQLRLRDFQDLMRWVAGNFVDDAEWREMPRVVEVCPGISVELPWR